MAVTRILIIEDERQTVDELRDNLEFYGYETEVALAVPVGFSIVEERKMDLAVVGEEVHEVSGLDILKKLKELDPDIKVVMITSQRSKRHQASLLRSGAHGVLTQPLEKESSLKLIEGVVKTPLVPKKKKKKKASKKIRPKVKKKVKKEVTKKVKKKAKKR
ncbi:MAG: response regulator [Candidatus Brocadiales bacterium]|nr:response regulator [Candidatus Bathyanammoxibius amoris]